MAKLLFNQKIKPATPVVEQLSVKTEVDLDLDDLIADDFDQLNTSKPEVSEVTMEVLRDKLQQLELQLGDPSLLKVVRSSVTDIMTDIQAHPQFADLISPDDIGLIVRAAAQSYQQIASGKATRRSKRTDTKQTQAMIAKELDEFWDDDKDKKDKKKDDDFDDDDFDLSELED